MKLIQAYCGPVPKRLLPMVKKMRKMYPDHELHDLGAARSIRLAVKKSDVFRHRMALKTPGMLWCDCDCVTNGVLAFPGDRPSFAFLSGQPDHFLFYSPDPSAWFEVEADRIRRGIRTTTYAFIRKLWRDKGVNEIDESQYTHLRCSSGGA